MRPADARVDLDSLAVVETLRRVVVRQRERYSGAGFQFGVEFQCELFAIGGEDGWLDYAAGKDYGLAGAGVNYWGWAGAVPGFGCDSNEVECERYARWCEVAIAIAGGDRQDYESCDWPGGFVCRESE